MTHEEVLRGGVANVGAVRRVGDVVLLQVSAAVIRRRVREGTFPVPAVQFGGKTSTIMFERVAVERHFRPVANADSKELAAIQALNEAGLTVGQAVTAVNVMKCSDLTGAELVGTAFPTRWAKS